MVSPLKSWQRFWWPKVDTPENAATAAKNGGVAFGFIALGFAIITLRMFWAHAWIPYRQTLLGNRRILSDPHHHHTMLWDPQSLLRYRLYDLLPLVIILLIAALFAWRAYKRPSLLRCTIALVGVLLYFVGTVSSWHAPLPTLSESTAL